MFLLQGNYTEFKSAWMRAKIKAKLLLKMCKNTLKLTPLRTYNYDKIILPIRFNDYNLPLKFQ